MKTRCPNCGALASLDALMGNDEASAAIAAVARIGGELGKRWIKYIGMFRPTKTQLTFDRVAKLTNECISDIELQRIERNGQVFNAPPEAWIYGIDQVIKARDSGKLKTPLTSHGYLYEIIAGYQPKTQIVEKPSDNSGLNRMAIGLGYGQSSS